MLFLGTFALLSLNDLREAGGWPGAGVIPDRKVQFCAFLLFQPSPVKEQPPKLLPLENFEHKYW